MTTSRYTPRYGRKEPEKRDIFFRKITINFGLTDDDEKRLTEMLRAIADEFHAEIRNVECEGPDRDGRYIDGEPRTYIIKVKESG
jgi:hypothetical protein